MGIVFRQSVKTTIVTFAGTALGTVIQLISVFILAQRELGFYRTTITIGYVLQFVVMMGMGAVLAVFIQKYPEKDEKRKVLITTSAIITFLAIVVHALLFALFKEQLVRLYNIDDRPLVHKYYYYIPILVGIWGFMSLLDQYLVSQFKIAFSAFSREVLLRICNLAILGLYYYRLIDFHYFIALSVLTYIIPAGLLWIASAKTKGFGFSLNFKAFSNKEYKEITHFAWYHLLWGLSQNLFGFMDTIMLSFLDKSGLKSVAAYGIGVMVIGILVIPYRAMAGSAFPILNKAYINNEHDHLRALYKRSAISIFIACMALFGVIICNIDNLVALLPADYQVVKPILIILMIGRLIDMATGLNNEVISISSYYKFNFRASALLVLVLFFLYRLLIPRYGVYGAAWGTTIGFSAINAAKVIFLWVKMRLQPFTKGTLLVLFSTGVAVGIGYIVPYIINPYVDAVIRSLAVLTVYGGLLLWLKPSEDLRNYLKTVKTSKRLF